MAKHTGPQTDSISIAAAAKRLGCSRNTLLGWINRGDLPGAFRTNPRHRGRIRIPMDVLEEFESQRVIQPGDAHDTDKSDDCAGH